MADQGQVKTTKLDPQALARRQLALAQIRQYPDPVLRMRAHEVEDFGDDLAQLVSRMTKLMHDANGVGLAANQVGVLQRVFILLADDDDKALSVLVNPQIVERSDEETVDNEGCLSLQGVAVSIDRAEWVRIEARDAEGEPVSLELEGLSARVAQHELDHLDGILILDRTTPDSRREAMGVLRRSDY